MKKNDQYFMKMALLEAQRAYDIGEVPVGAVLVKEGTIIGCGYNQREFLQDPTAHAEIFALKAGAKKLKSWRLCNTTLFVTLEPCPMCAGAIMLSRVEKVVFGTDDPKGGALKSLLQLYDIPGFNHQVVYQGGVLKEQCRKILKDFFADLRSGRVSESG